MALLQRIVGLALAGSMGITLGLGAGPACLFGDHKQADGNILDLANASYNITQKVEGLTRRYTVESLGAYLGHIDRPLMGSNAKFTFFNAQDKAVGEIAQEVQYEANDPYRWKLYAAIRNEQGLLIGWIDQVTAFDSRHPLDYGHTFQIKQPDGAVLLVSDQTLAAFKYHWDLWTADRSRKIGEIDTRDWVLGERETTISLNSTSIDRRLILALITMELEIMEVTNQAVAEPTDDLSIEGEEEATP